MYRITFSPNNIKEFTFETQTWESAVILFDSLTKFDLGLEYSSNPHVERMITLYKAYRRRNGINHPDLIQFSYGSIDQKDESGWWIISENGEEREFEIGEQPAFDNWQD